MKKTLLLMVCVIFLFSTQTFAIDKPASPIKSDAAKVNIVKAAKMHATGKVIEISNELIKIERTVKGDIETMEFFLEKPSADILVNDSVKIEYTETDGKLMASRISKIIIKKKLFNKPDTKSDSGKK